MVTGSIIGVGFHGRISGTVTATALTGSCDCQTSSLGGNLPIDGEISGNDMVFRLRDSRMTLTRIP